MTNVIKEVDTVALEILSQYQKDVERWKTSKAHYVDIQPLTVNDVLYLRAVIHPTNRQASKDFTRELIEYICDKGIVTAKQIYEDRGYSDKPVLTRLRIFKRFGLVRRESKKYYLPTPRLLTIRDKYLSRLCD